MPESTSVAAALAERFNQYRAEIEHIAEQLRAHKKLIDLCPVPLFFANNVGDCIYVNKLLAAMLAVTVFDLQGTGWQQVLTERSHDAVITSWYEFVKDPCQKTYEIEAGLMRKGRSPIDVLIKAEQLPDGNILGFAIPLRFVGYVAWIRGADLSSLPDFT